MTARSRRTPRRLSAADRREARHHGHSQRDAGFVFRRRTLSVARSARSRRRASWSPTAPTSSTSARNRPGRDTRRFRSTRNGGASSRCSRLCWPRSTRRSRSTPTRPKSRAARSALGVAVVNDVWGLQKDPAMADVVAESGAAVVIMHNRDGIDPDLDVEADLSALLRSLAGACRSRRHPALAHPARSRHRLRQEQGAEPQGARADRRPARGLRSADPDRGIAQAPDRANRPAAPASTSGSSARSRPISRRSRAARPFSASMTQPNTPRRSRCSRRSSGPAEREGVSLPRAGPRSSPRSPGPPRRSSPRAGSRPGSRRPLRGARGKHEDPVGESDRLVDVVGHEHGDHATAFDEPRQIALQLPGERRVERNERLVEQEQASGERRRRAPAPRVARGRARARRENALRWSARPSAANSAAISVSLASGAASRTLSSTLRHGNSRGS